MLKKLAASAFAITGIALFFAGGGFATLGFISLMVGLLVLVRPDGGAGADSEHLRYGDPARDTTRSDYFMGDPRDGGFGDGGGPL
jgi:hypothetical protein